jgi:C-terminal processing protease CtpA/Prc
MGRGRLGVRIEDLSPELGEYFEVPGGHGVLVVEVMKDTPAERAGLRSGDVITSVGDRDIKDSDDLIRALREEEGKVSINVVRRGNHRTIEAELDKADRQVLRVRPGEGMMGFRGRSSEREERMRQEIRELREELKDLKKELEDLRNN